MVSQSIEKSIGSLIYTAISMLFIFIELSSPAVIQCEVETVEYCQNTPDLWNAAVQRKNCSANHCGSNTVYHCLPTEKGQLVEVCANPINLNEKCPYYDTVGKLIQRSEKSCVSANFTKNCTDVYSSADVYNYSVCYLSPKEESTQGITNFSPSEELSHGVTDASSSGATRIHDDPTRFWIIIFIVNIFKSNQMIAIHNDY